MVYGFNEDKSKADISEVIYDYTYDASENPTYSEVVADMGNAIHALEFDKNYELEIQITPVVSAARQFYRKVIFRQAWLETNYTAVQGYVDRLKLVSQGYSESDDDFRKTLYVQGLNRSELSAQLLYSYSWTFSNDAMTSVNRTDIKQNPIKSGLVDYPQNYSVRVIFRAYED